MAKLTGSITISGGNADYAFSLHMQVDDANLETIGGVGDAVKSAVEKALASSPHVPALARTIEDQKAQIKALKEKLGVVDQPKAAEEPAEEQHVDKGSKKTGRRR